MARRYLALSAALVIPVTATVALLALSNGNEPEEGGVIRLPGQHATPGPTSLQAPAPSLPRITRRLTIVATQQDADLAGSRSLAVATEPRDSVWAERNETALAVEMHRITYIGGRQRLDIRCAATLCEVVGIAEPDSATNSYQPIWQALERDTAADALRALGLERVTRSSTGAEARKNSRSSTAASAPEPSRAAAG